MANSLDKLRFSNQCVGCYENTELTWGNEKQINTKIFNN